MPPPAPGAGGREVRVNGTRTGRRAHPGAVAGADGAWAAVGDGRPRGAVAYAGDRRWRGGARLSRANRPRASGAPSARRGPGRRPAMARANDTAIGTAAVSGDMSPAWRCRLRRGCGPGAASRRAEWTSAAGIAVAAAGAVTGR